MVNYKLGISKNKESRIIDLDRVVRLKGLEKLDEFTQSFNSEEELKLYLYKQGLITKEELSHNITVMYKYGGKAKKLPIIYQDMKTYLDIDHLRYDLMSLSYDINFLEKLARHYSIGSDKFNPQGINVNAIRYYVSEVRVRQDDEFSRKKLDTAIQDLYIKALYKLEKSTGELKFNYRGLRDLAIFIYKYRKSLEKEEIKKEIQKEKDSFSQINMFDKSFQESYLERKTTQEENQNIEDMGWTQITLFDSGLQKDNGKSK